MYDSGPARDSRRETRSHASGPALPHVGSAARRWLVVAFLLVGPLVPAPLSAGAETQGSALRVSDVIVEGHESLSTREITRVLLPSPEATLVDSELSARVDSLLGLYAQLGRPFARVRLNWPEGDDGTVLAVDIDEGPLVKLAELNLSGVESLAQDDLRSRMDLGPGAVVTGATLERDIDALLRAYDDNGRPFASVTLRAPVLNDGERLGLSLQVDEGIETRFGGVAVSGNAVTRDHVVVRETGVVEGELYSASALSRVRPRLEKLGIFRRVSEPSVAVDPSSGIAAVGIEVEEGPANSISGILGYAPGSGQDEGEFTGGVDVHLGNIAGTGRRATAEWRRTEPRQTRITFSYLEPWVLAAPIDIGVSGAQTVRDTIYTTTEADVSVTSRMGEGVRVTWSIGAERYVPGAAGELTTTAYRTAVELDLDRTDAPANPTRGVSLSGAVEYSAKDLGEAGGQRRLGSAKVVGHAFVPVASRRVITVGAWLEGLIGSVDDVPFHEQIPLGGATSLRGYREEQFRATRVAVGTIEYRWILARRARAAAFVDVGYYFRGGANPAKDTKLGYGIGLRGDTRLGIISVDYGLGEGDALLDGKLHVGLIREF